jgi:uncharacterized protein (TIGR02598 family)
MKSRLETRPARSARSARSAFTLIEVTLALGVATFCLTSVFGLVPIGLTTNQNSSQQTTAAGIATAVSADLRGTPAANGTTSRFQIPVPSSAALNQVHTLFFSQGGTPAPGSTVDSLPVASGSNPSLYQATITFNADPNSPKVFKVWILVTWPALAAGTQSQPSMPSSFAGSYETATVLNCN